MTLTEIEAEYGPLVEIGVAPSGAWDAAELREARARRLLWTRVEPGLVSTGLHFVNREAYFRAARPYAEGTEVVEVDDDIAECATCGAWTWCSPDALCDDCREATDGATPR